MQTYLGELQWKNYHFDQLIRRKDVNGPWEKEGILKNIEQPAQLPDLNSIEFSFGITWTERLDNITQDSNKNLQLFMIRL